MEKKIGIWLDLEQAYLIEGDAIRTISSDVEHFHLTGGSRANTPYGAQDASSESKHLERKKHQLDDYFKRLSNELGSADQFVVFGPAETKTGFKKFIEANGDLAGKLAGVETADSMSENQLKEWVRNYFS
jgi:stalled ribosome rescue protein Dom34